MEKQVRTHGTSTTFADTIFRYVTCCPRKNYKRRHMTRFFSYFFVLISFLVSFLLKGLHSFPHKGAPYGGEVFNEARPM